MAPLSRSICHPRATSVAMAGWTMKMLVRSAAAPVIEAGKRWVRAAAMAVLALVACALLFAASSTAPWSATAASAQENDDGHGRARRPLVVDRDSHVVVM